MSYVKLEERITGYRTFSGAQWPISNAVYLHHVGSRRPLWIVAVGLCRGVPQSTRSYSSRRDALVALGSL